MYVDVAFYTQVEETERGWYITLIMKDPKKTAEDEARSKRERAELAEDERARRQLEAQIERAKRAKLEGGQVDEADTLPPEAHELRRSDSDKPVTISLGNARPVVAQEAPARPAPAPGYAVCELMMDTCWMHHSMLMLMHDCRSFVVVCMCV